MAKTVISTDAAPKAIGPYSQAIVMNGFVYTAGQIPIDPATSKLVDGDVQAQTAQVIQNLDAVLKEARSSLDDVVKTTVFLKDLADFAKMNDVYGRAFGTAPPARSTVQVARLPCDALVEIEAVAAVRP